jgi:hypothetical protein
LINDILRPVRRCIRRAQVGVPCAPTWHHAGLCFARKWWSWPLHPQNESLRDKDARNTCATERVCPICFLIRNIKKEIPGRWNRRYRLRQLPTSSRRISRDSAGTDGGNRDEGGRTPGGVRQEHSRSVRGGTGEGGTDSTDPRIPSDLDGIAAVKMRTYPVRLR